MLRLRHVTGLAAGAVLLTACGGASGDPGATASPTEGGDGTAAAVHDGDCPVGEFPWDAAPCEPSSLIDYGEVISGGPPPDGIPPVDAPVFETIDAGDEWLEPQSPVLTVSVDGDARAYPLAILTWHEIVNDVVAGVPLVVTYCPLCNSGLVFERTVDDAVLDFGTSGRLYRSNLVMYDRQTRTLWSQFSGTGVVGDGYLGTQLERVPSSILSWDEFKAAAPDGQVLSRETGHQRPYGSNPYERYDAEGSVPFLYDGPTDERLLMMTRVVGLGGPDGDAVAVVRDHLAETGVVDVTVDGDPVALLWTDGAASALDQQSIDDGARIGSVSAVRPVTDDGTVLSLAANGDGTFSDAETDTTWDVLGQAVDGPLAGQRLRPVSHDDTFWFVWFAFVPDTEVVPPPTG